MAGLALIDCVIVAVDQVGRGVLEFESQGDDVKSGMRSKTQNDSRGKVLTFAKEVGEIA